MREFQLAVLRLHDDREPGAEIAVVEIGAAGEAAAILRFRAVQPEGKAERIAEDGVELAGLQLGEPVGGRVKQVDVKVGKEAGEIGRVRRAADDADTAAPATGGPGSKALSLRATKRPGIFR